MKNGILAMSFMFLFVGTANAAFVLDCGNPISGFPMDSAHSYKIDFNSNGSVYLKTIDISSGGSVTQQMAINYVTKEITAYYAGNINVARNESGVFLNVFGLADSLIQHSECK